MDVVEPLIVDLCTGSGAIALAMAQEVPRSRVHAVELSEDALQLDPEERRGVQGHRSTSGDALSALPELDGQVDLVISNPPYIPLTEWEYVAPEARDHDPELALFSGEDGLDTIRGIERTAHRLLRPGGRRRHRARRHPGRPGAVDLHRGAGLGRRGRPPRPEQPAPVRDRPQGHAVTTGTPAPHDPTQSVHVRGGRLMARRYDCNDATDRTTGLREAASAVRRGELVVLPTDTVYGIGADAFSSEAVADLLDAKGRGRNMPTPVLIGSPNTLHGLVTDFSEQAWELVDAFWPGALTLVAKHQPSLQWDLGRHPRHRRRPDAAAPGRHRAAHRGRPDGRLQRQPHRTPLARGLRRRPGDARRLASPSTSTAARPPASSRPRSSTSPARSRCCCGRAPSTREELRKVVPDLEVAN